MTPFRKIFPNKPHFIFRNLSIFALVNPRENGLMKKAHFSLYSAIGKLGHFTKDAGISENECFLGVLYFYDATSGVIQIPYLHHGSPSPTNRDRAKMNGSTLFYCKVFLFESLGKMVENQM